jgi:hypothetical protein
VLDLRIRRRRERVRKLTPIAVACVALGALIYAAVAFAAAQTTLEVKATPNKASTKKKVRPLQLTVNVTFSDPAQAQPPPLQRVVIRLQKGGVFNGKLFPKCKSSLVLARGPKACPKGSKVGSGTATASAQPVIARVNAKITLFNGELKGGKPTVLLYSVPDISSPLTVSGVIEKKSPSACGAGGQCDYTLTFDVPDIPTLPGQPNASVLTVNTKTDNVFIKKKKKVRGKRRTTKIPYIGAPRECKGKWVAESTVTYKDGQVATAQTSAPCRK